MALGRISLPPLHLLPLLPPPPYLTTSSLRLFRRRRDRGEMMRGVGEGGGEGTQGGYYVAEGGSYPR